MTPRIVYSIFLVMLIGCFSNCSYLPEEIPAEESLLIEENARYIRMRSTESNNSLAGILFYPGGLVDPHAYIEALKALVLEDHRTVIIMKAPSNLAIIRPNQASSISKEFEDLDQWIIGGHSLGGSVACIDIFNHPDQFAALFLLASYSVDDLSNRDIPMISITSSNDLVLNQEAFEENKINLPEEFSISDPSQIPMESTRGTTIYYSIEGGNHAQFGQYGPQAGDGEADIESSAQQALVIESLRLFFQSNNL